ncbi:MAG: hypothetical protein A3K19_23435 [Lentisphaerae bacterium RIFOXYB12_FULL_65_16]|nr:MAG: hypothetical protein A3K19_23435 [Lentisphaerae bacterium RIFOXYB12_FULL_65_16]
MAICRHFKEYMAEQERGLRKAIDEDKWYLSERAGHDVGFFAAEEDFCQYHLDRFARIFRIEFCRHRCPERDKCELAPGVENLPSTEEMLENVQEQLSRVEQLATVSGTAKT